jgi:CheY-like chemotaxis protein
MEKKKILIIDDEKGFTDTVKEILEETGKYQVEAENNAEEAISAVKRFRPHLILLDVVIPGIDGPHLAEKIKSDDDIEDLPIVFVSALFTSDPDDLSRSSLLLSKPIGVQNLIDCIENSLALYKKIDFE